LPNLHRNDFSRGWLPDSDAANAPANALLRADNCTLDEDGVLKVRQGSAKLYSQFTTPANVDAIYSTKLAGTTYVLAQDDDTDDGTCDVYSNGSSLSLALGGSGDLSFGSHMGQILIARGAIRKKYDGTTVRNWGITAPPAKATLAAVDLATKTMSTFVSGESPAWTAEEGTINGTYPTGADGTATGALEIVTPTATTGRSAIIRTLNAETDFNNFGGAKGSPSDLIDLLFWDAQPHQTEFVTLMFDCNGDSTNRFQDDFYIYTWDFDEEQDDPQSLGLTREETIDEVKRLLGVKKLPSETGSPDDGTEGGDTEDEPFSPAPEVTLEEQLETLGKENKSKSSKRKDMANSNQGWTHLVVPRGRFERVGTTEGKGWNSIKAIKIIYKCTDGTTGTVRYDDLQVTAGGEGQVLTGTYRVRYRLGYNSGKYVELSPPSPISDAITLKAQALKVTIPEATALAMDTQANVVWTYIYSDLLGGYYRTIAPFNLDRPKIHATEFDDYGDGVWSEDDRLRTATVGLVPGRRYTPGESSIVTYTTTGTSTPGVASTGYLYPTATTLAEWTVNGASTTHEATDDPKDTPDDGTTTISCDPSGGEKDALCSFGPVPSNIASIDSVTIYIRNKKIDAVSAPAKAMVKINGNIYTSTISLTTTWQTRSVTWTLNPDTGSAWTAADLSSAVFGVRQQSGGSTTSSVTQMYLEISYTSTPTTVAATQSTRSLLAFTAVTSDIELLINNRLLDELEGVPPDNIVGIAGPHFGRLFCLTTSHLWMSLPNNPGVFKKISAVRIGDGKSETGLWVAKTSGGLYLGTDKDIYRIEGTFAELQNGTLDLAIRALNINSPPIDAAFAQEGNQLVYHASDGWRLFSGEMSVPFHEDLDLIHRGVDRYGVTAINHGDGSRYRCALHKGYFTYVTPTATQLLRYDSIRQRWFLLTHSASFRALHRDVDGRLLAGDNNGFVWQLDTGTQDDGSDIAVTVWTPEYHNNQPLQRKEMYDVSLGMDTNGNSAKCVLYLDGSAETSFAASPTGQRHHLVVPRSKVDPLGLWVYPDGVISDSDKRRLATVGFPGPGLDLFRRVQARITGSFSTFALRELNVSYRDLPQHKGLVDTGYVPTGSEDIRWIREIKLLVRSNSDLTVTPWFDDTAFTAKTLTATGNKTKIYSLMMGREYKGRQPRLQVETSAAAGADDMGFELYWVEWRERRSGALSQKPVARWPVEGSTTR